MATSFQSDRNRASLFLFLASMILIPAACGGESGEAARAQIALGEQIYQANCAACHGANLEGEQDWKLPTADGQFRAPPHDETGHTWHHGNAYLVESIRYGGARLPAEIGISNMPAYEGVLTDAEIAAVLAYIKSSWPPDIRASQESRQ